MKRDNRQKNSLRRQLTLHHILLTGIMALLCIGLLVWTQLDSMEFQKMLRHKSTLNEYFININQIQTDINAYNTTLNQEYLLQLQERVLLAADQAEDLCLYYDDPLFLDQYHITLSLHQAVNNAFPLTAQSTQNSFESPLSTASYIVSLLQNNEYNIINAENTIFESYFAEINRNHSIRLALVVLITSLIILFCFVLSFRLSSRMVAPLEFLTGQVREAAQNLLEYRPMQQEDSANEIAILSETFRSMVLKLQSQMQEIREKMKMSEKLKELELQNMRKDMLLLESELRAVQSLINPHFLYNSLGVISSLTYLENAPKAREATQKIARFLRESFHDVGKIVTIEAELERLHHYLDIQKLRFEDRIRFHIQCHDAVRQSGIPAMTLQPIVENAIIHGLSEREEDGCVDICIEPKEECVRIQITDNGIGMDKEKISLITDTPRPEEKVGIGLRSVLLQLRMCFSDQGSLSIESKPMEYTRISVTFPDMPPDDIHPQS